MEKILNLTVRRGYLITDTGESWHRIVYEQHYGKPRKGWHVHHINRDSLDNRPENLIALPEYLHKRAHLKGSSAPSREELERWLRDGAPKIPKLAKKKKKKKKLKRPGTKPITLKPERELIDQFIRENNVQVMRKKRVIY